MSGITIWGVGTLRTQRVHWMLHELGLEYTSRRIESRTGETQTEEYLAINPKGKIPAMQHGGLVLAESLAIMRYLRSISHSMPLPREAESPGSRAKYDEWLSFMLMELDATSLYVIRRHQGLPDIYGEAPNAVESARVYAAKMLAAVAGKVQKGPLWCDSFSELDIIFTSCLDWAEAVGISLPGQLAAYRDLMHTRPAFEAAAMHNYRDLKIPTRPLR